MSIYCTPGLAIKSQNAHDFNVKQHILYKTTYLSLSINIVLPSLKYFKLMKLSEH